MILNIAQQVPVDMIFNTRVSKISGVYANPSYWERRLLWSDSIRARTQNITWVVIGDFNAVMGAHKKGGHLPPIMSCDEFIAFSDTSDLIHMDKEGAQCMWTNGRQGRSHINI